MIDEYIKKEKELISFMKTTWLYSRIQSSNNNFVSIDDIALPPPYKLLKIKCKPLAVEFKKNIGGFGDFLSKYKKYKMQTLKFDDVSFITDTSDYIVGGAILHQKNLFGFFETLNMIDTSCRGEWSMHNKLIHFSESTDKSLYNLMDFSILTDA